MSVGESFEGIHKLRRNAFRLERRASSETPLAKICPQGRTGGDFGQRFGHDNVIVGFVEENTSVARCLLHCANTCIYGYYRYSRRHSFSDSRGEARRLGKHEEHVGALILSNEVAMWNVTKQPSVQTMQSDLFVNGTKEPVVICAPEHCQLCPRFVKGGEEMESRNCPANSRMRLKSPNDKYSGPVTWFMISGPTGELRRRKQGRDHDRGYSIEIRRPRRYRR
jgi:hypothetical protein